jgi:hypothetical protein
MQLYRKTSRNMDQMAAEFRNPWTDPDVTLKRDLAAQLYALAKSRQIELTICSQPEIVTCQPPSRCIDAKRLSDVAGRLIAVRTLGNRPGCECALSRDIGDYDIVPMAACIAMQYAQTNWQYGDFANTIQKANICSTTLDLQRSRHRPNHSHKDHSEFEQTETFLGIH